MKNKYIDTMFNEFLIINKCRNVYYKIITKNKNLETSVMNLIDEYPLGLIDVFIWADTEQGNDYWAKLNDKWATCLDNFENHARFLINEKWYVDFIRLLKNYEMYPSFLKKISPTKLLNKKTPKQIFECCYLIYGVNKNNDKYKDIICEWEQLCSLNNYFN